MLSFTSCLPKEKSGRADFQHRSKTWASDPEKGASRATEKAVTLDMVSSVQVPLFHIRIQDRGGSIGSV